VQTPLGTLTLPSSPDHYKSYLRRAASRLDAHGQFALFRVLGMYDLYFLLRHILSTKTYLDSDGRSWFDHPWLFARCREVQAQPDGMLDVWAREHFKSTIISFGLSWQDILRNPDVTLAFFSITRPLAKRLLRQIKIEAEDNQLLKYLYPDVLWDQPRKQAPVWSLDDGLVFRRSSNPAAATVEAWGLIDGQPTGKHFLVRVYDDAIEESTVTSIDMMEKAVAMWALSTNLGVVGAGKARYIGTRYHFNDLYHEILNREAAVERRYPCVEPANMQEGEPVLFPMEHLKQRYKEQGPYVFSCQNLCNPVADDVQGFKVEWLQTYKEEPEDVGKTTNNYLLVDPANEKKRTSDYTVMVVLGLGLDGNYYLLDGLRDRFNLAERTSALFALHQLWRPIETRYEQYGIDSDIQHIQYVQGHRNYRFALTKVRGNVKKEDRIRRLVPVCEGKRLYVPDQLYKRDWQGKGYDLVDVLKEEMEAFPVGIHDDLLDAAARIAEPDLSLIWPDIGEQPFGRRDKWYRPPRDEFDERSWVSA
jgi:predicted phage terminase large subunit-like protein